MTPAVVTSDDYRKLCDLGDRCLRLTGVSPAWVGNPYFHPVSEHPVHLETYRKFVPSAGRMENHVESTSGGGGDRLRRVLKRIWRLGRDSLVRKIPDPPGQIDVLLVAWLVNDRHVAEDADFYFGRLQEEIAEKGCRSLLILGNQSGKPSASLARRVARDGACARRLIPDALSPAVEIGHLAACWVVRRRLRRMAARSPEPAVRNYLYGGADLIYWPEMLLALRIHKTVERLSRRYAPRAVCCLYEGHAWERLVWAAARSVSPAVRCCGYQHTIVRRHAHGMRRRLGGLKSYDPDVIFTLGDITAAMLRRSKPLQPTQIVTLGTHRLPHEDQMAKAPNRFPGVLVLPEGLDAESRLMFQFTCAAARQLPSVRFVFRTHPIYPPDRILAVSGNRDRLPPNVSFSVSGAIEDDYRKAGQVLYRGSSTAIYAVLYGLRPYYIKVPGFSIDPLFELETWKSVVTDPGDFLAAYTEDQHRPAAERHKEWRVAADYCNRYVMPYQANAIELICRAR